MKGYIARGLCRTIISNNFDYSKLYLEVKNKLVFYYVNYVNHTNLLIMLNYVKQNFWLLVEYLVVENERNIIP